MEKWKSFYHTLRAGAAPIYQQIRESDSTKHKVYLAAVLTLSTILLVAFCVLFCVLVTTLFGQEFSYIGVAVVVMLLTLEKVHFSYCIQDTLWTLAIVMAIILLVPTLCLYVPKWSLIFIHLISLFIVFTILCQRPEMRLGAMMGFCYAFLYRDPITIEHMPDLLLCLLFCYVVLALVMVHKHHAKDRDVRFWTYIRHFSFRNLQNLWHIRLTLGLAITLTIGLAFEIPRFTWMCFAVSTVLAVYPYAGDCKGRIWERVEGIAIGCAIFFVICQFIPTDENTMTMLGMLMGVVLAFFSSYRIRTIVICTGPLALGVPLFGVEGATFLRLLENIVGAVCATLFALLFDKLVVEHLVPDYKKKLPAEEATQVERTPEDVPVVVEG